MLPPVFFVCSRCGAVVPPDARPGYRCPVRPRDRSGDGHRLVREVDSRLLHWPDLGPVNPILRFRQMSTPYLRFRLAGGSDSEFVDRVEELEALIRAGTGAGFASGRLERSEGLELVTGRDVRAAVYLQDLRRFAGGPGVWRGLVFALLPTWLEDEGRALGIPRGAPDAEPTARLAAIVGADVVADVDPDAFDDTLWLPWTGWRDLNAWVFEGEMFWAYEAVEQIRRREETLHRLFVGGDGRGAASWLLALREAFRLGAMEELPRIHVVEERDRASVGPRYDEALHEILSRIDPQFADGDLEAAVRSLPALRREVADRLVIALRRGPDHPGRRAVEEGLRALPPRGEPGGRHEMVLVRAMIESGGFPLGVDEDEVRRARLLARGREEDLDRVDGSDRRAEFGRDREGARAPGLLVTSRQLSGVAAAGALQLHRHGELPESETLLVVDDEAQRMREEFDPSCASRA